MLVLSRKVGESVIIDSDIIVTVVEVRNGRIRLGIQAPPRVHVLRSELTEPREDEHPVSRLALIPR